MEEFSKIQNILKRKHHTIPKAVQYWLFFKHHLLEKEDIRKQFEEAHLDESEFRQQLRSIANPKRFGPKFCRKSPSYMNDLMVICWQYYLALLHPSSPVYVKKSEIPGLGIFTRDNTTLHERNIVFKKHLYGLLLEVGENDFEELEESSYPSLYSVEQKNEIQQFILVGPLSLVNHNCFSPFCFTTPSKTVAAEEFEGINTVHARLVSEEDDSDGDGKYLLKKNTELYVNYYSDHVGVKGKICYSHNGRCQCVQN